MAILHKGRSRVLLGKLARMVGVPRRGEHEPYPHWAKRSARLSTLQLRDPDPLSKTREADAAGAVDVVIPVGPRDTEILRLTLEGVKQNVAGPVHEISCVAPPEVCVELRQRYPDVTVIDERDICGPELMARLRSRFGARAGWFVQQLITLSTPEITNADAVLVVDADTVLLRPRHFRRGQTTLLLTEREFHIPYFKALARLWHEPVALPPFSCVAHHMCFLREDVFAMRMAIEALWNSHWIDAVLECSDAGESSGFSEYELYGQWRLKTARNLTKARPARNVGRRRSTDVERGLGPGDGLVGSRAYSVSYHWHI